MRIIYTYIILLAGLILALVLILLESRNEKNIRKYCISPQFHNQHTIKHWKFANPAVYISLIKSNSSHFKEEKKRRIANCGDNKFINIASIRCDLLFFLLLLHLNTKSSAKSIDGKC